MRSGIIALWFAVASTCAWAQASFYEGKTVTVVIGASGGSLEIAARIADECFPWLDAPVRVIGALDTPVPYSPPLEEFYLPSEAQIERAARLLAAY